MALWLTEALANWGTDIWLDMSGITGFPVLLPSPSAYSSRIALDYNTISEATVRLGETGKNREIIICFDFESQIGCFPFSFAYIQHNYVLTWLNLRQLLVKMGSASQVYPGSWAGQHQYNYLNTTLGPLNHYRQPPQTAINTM